METKIKHALFSAITKLLRPLVRILLRNGVPFRTFADLAKWIYVDVAMKEFGIQGRKQTDSRVSIITGLSRKEVRRLKTLEQLSDAEAIDRYNRAARVITGWIRDRRFTDARGNPRALNFEKGRANFSDLVKSFSGDVPARAVLDELMSVGTVEFLEDGKIKLLSRAYIPLSDEPAFLSILGTDVAHLIKTIDHNMVEKDGQPFFQRKVSYDNLPIEAIPQLRRMSAGLSQKLLERMDRWLSAHDRDANPATKGRGRMRAGLGIYYFEEDWEKEHPDSE
jgi:hypothetical protein